MTPEQIAQQFHEAYERLAPDFGYKTREASAKPWAEVPEQNRCLMIAVAAEVGARIAASGEQAGEIAGVHDPISERELAAMERHAGYREDERRDEEIRRLVTAVRAERTEIVRLRSELDQCRGRVRGVEEGLAMQRGGAGDVASLRTARDQLAWIETFADCGCHEEPHLLCHALTVDIPDAARIGREAIDVVLHDTAGEGGPDDG